MLFSIRLSYIVWVWRNFGVANKVKAEGYTIVCIYEIILSDMWYPFFNPPTRHYIYISTYILQYIIDSWYISCNKSFIHLHILCKIYIQVKSIIHISDSKQEHKYYRNKEIFIDVIPTCCDNISKKQKQQQQKWKESKLQDLK